MFEEGSEGCEGVSQADLWGKHISGRGNSPCKGPESGT